VERLLRILVVDDDEGIRWAMTGLLEGKGHAVRQASSVAEARREIDREAPEVAFIDFHLGDGTGIDVVRKLRQAAPGAAGVIVTGQATIRAAVQALKEGAFDFVEKPVSAERILPVLDRAELYVRSRKDAPGAARGELAALGQTPLLGSSAAMAAVLTSIRQVMQTKSTTALVLGESGTGKELVARAIHHGSVRRQARFIAVNCAALSDSLLESELFGYEKGSFTGAAAAGKLGLFEAANKGTIFLDELGEMNLPMQAKLLRVLQERTIKRVGGVDDVPIDARVVASTNRDLSKEVKEGRFRLDLFHRLNVFVIRMPALRERVDDLPLLAEYFLAEMAREFGKELTGIAPDAMAALAAYRFPGNVRELRNIIEHAAIVAPGPLIQREHLVLEPEDAPPAPVEAKPRGSSPGSGSGPVLTPGGTPAPGGILLSLADEKLETAERELIVRVLERVRGNRKKAAERLGINRSTLYAKLKAFGISDGAEADAAEG